MHRPDQDDLIRDCEQDAIVLRPFVVVGYDNDQQQTHWELVPAETQEQAVERAERLHPRDIVVASMPRDAFLELAREISEPVYVAEEQLRSAERGVMLEDMKHRIANPGAGDPIAPQHVSLIMRATHCTEAEACLMAGIITNEVFAGASLDRLSRPQWREGLAWAQELLPDCKEFVAQAHLRQSQSLFHASPIATAPAQARQR